jgi:hypothetical protein
MKEKSFITLTPGWHNSEMAMTSTLAYYAWMANDGDISFLAMVALSSNPFWQCQTLKCLIEEISIALMVAKLIVILAVQKAIAYFTILQMQIKHFMGRS